MSGGPRLLFLLGGAVLLAGAAIGLAADAAWDLTADPDSAQQTVNAEIRARLEPDPAEAENAHDPKARAPRGAEEHPTVALPPELARVLTDYERAWRAKDAAALAALFTEDGWVLSSGRPPVRGREAIARRYANSGGPLALRALAWSVDGSLGTIIGAYARNEGEPDIGKFTLTLRRGDDGRWLIASDMDNGNQR